jgi:hypothetical protein
MHTTGPKEIPPDNGKFKLTTDCRPAAASAAPSVLSPAAAAALAMQNKSAELLATENRTGRGLLGGSALLHSTQRTLTATPGPPGTSDRAVTVTPAGRPGRRPPAGAAAAAAAAESRARDSDYQSQRPGRAPPTATARAAAAAQGPGPGQPATPP